MRRIRCNQAVGFSIFLAVALLGPRALSEDISTKGSAGDLNTSFPDTTTEIAKPIPIEIAELPPGAGISSNVQPPTEQDQAQWKSDDKTESPSDTKPNVFGEDNRETLTVTTGPWVAIGKLSVGCTATLVYKDLVATAAHCVYDSETKELRPGPLEFYPNYMYGTARDRSTATYVWAGTNDPDHYRGYDWAILKIDRNLGNKYGWLGTRGTTVESFPAGLTVAGYSGDFLGGNTAGVHHNCTTRKRVPGANLIFHDCDTARGSSGGPALRMDDGNLVIVGLNVAEFRSGGESSLHVSEYADQYANVTIPIRGFVEKLREIIGLD